MISGLDWRSGSDHRPILRRPLDRCGCSMQCRDNRSHESPGGAGFPAACPRSRCASIPIVGFHCQPKSQTRMPLQRSEMPLGVWTCRHTCCDCAVIETAHRCGRYTLRRRQVTGRSSRPARHGRASCTCATRSTVIQPVRLSRQRPSVPAPWRWPWLDDHQRRQLSPSTDFREAVALRRVIRQPGARSRHTPCAPSCRSRRLRRSAGSAGPSAATARWHTAYCAAAEPTAAGVRIHLMDRRPWMRRYAGPLDHRLRRAGQRDLRVHS